MKVQMNNNAQHGKVTTSGLWVCESARCDGIHHYYVKAYS